SRRLLRVLERNEKGAPLPPRGLGEREHAWNGPKLAVESQLSDESRIRQSLRGEVPVRGENRKRDGDIQSRPRFREIGGREVHDDVLRRNRKSDVPARR